jgi:hypothetical protein
MDPESTSPEGARALVTILREHGVDVIAADDIAAVENAARPDTLILWHRRSICSTTTR